MEAIIRVVHGKTDLFDYCASIIPMVGHDIEFEGKRYRVMFITHEVAQSPVRDSVHVRVQVYRGEKI